MQPRRVGQGGQTIDLVGLCLNTVSLGELLCSLYSGIIAMDESSAMSKGMHDLRVVTHELYQRATSPPASAMASATAKPIPSAAPFTTMTFPFMENCSNTLFGVSGTGRGNPSLGVLLSDSETDMLRYAVGRLGSGLQVTLVRFQYAVAQDKIQCFEQ